MDMEAKNEPTVTYSKITESELLYIEKHYGFSNRVPDWIYKKAREQVILDGLKAQQRL